MSEVIETTPVCRSVALAPYCGCEAESTLTPLRTEAMANVEVCVLGRLRCGRRAWRGASKEEGLQEGGCAVKFSEGSVGDTTGALEGRGA